MVRFHCTEMECGLESYFYFNERNDVEDTLVVQRCQKDMI